MVRKNVKKLLLPKTPREKLLKYPLCLEYRISLAHVLPTLQKWQQVLTSCPDVFMCCPVFERLDEVKREKFPKIA